MYSYDPHQKGSVAPLGVFYSLIEGSFLVKIKIKKITKTKDQPCESKDKEGFRQQFQFSNYRIGKRDWFDWSG